LVSNSAKEKPPNARVAFVVAKSVGNVSYLRRLYQGFGVSREDSKVGKKGDLWYNLVRTKEKTAVDYTGAAESDKVSQWLPKASLRWQGVGFRLLVFFSDQEEVGFCCFCLS
jgi:hypothetical protein